MMRIVLRIVVRVTGRGRIFAVDRRKQRNVLNDRKQCISKPLSMIITRPPGTGKIGTVAYGSMFHWIAHS